MASGSTEKDLAGHEPSERSGGVGVACAETRRLALRFRFCGNVSHSHMNSIITLLSCLTPSQMQHLPGPRGLGNLGAVRAASVQICMRSFVFTI